MPLTPLHLVQPRIQQLYVDRSVDIAPGPEEITVDGQSCDVYFVTTRSAENNLEKYIVLDDGERSWCQLSCFAVHTGILARTLWHDPDAIAENVAALLAAAKAQIIPQHDSGFPKNFSRSAFSADHLRSALQESEVYFAVNTDRKLGFVISSTTHDMIALSKSSGNTYQAVAPEWNAHPGGPRWKVTCHFCGDDHPHKLEQLIHSAGLGAIKNEVMAFFSAQTQAVPRPAPEPPSPPQ